MDADDNDDDDDDETNKIKKERMSGELRVELTFLFKNCFVLSGRGEGPE